MKIHGIYKDSRHVALTISSTTTEDYPYGIEPDGRDNI
jgi:hypothetical protein